MTARPNHSKREFAFVIHASMDYLVVLRKYLDDFYICAIELTIFSEGIADKWKNRLDE